MYLVGLYIYCKKWYTDLPMSSSGNFLRTFRSRLQEGPIGVPKRQYALRNNPEEHSSHLFRGWSLKSRIRSPTPDKNLEFHGSEVQILKQTYTVNIYLIAVPIYSWKRKWETRRTCTQMAASHEQQKVGQIGAFTGYMQSAASLPLTIFVASAFLWFI